MIKSDGQEYEPKSLKVMQALLWTDIFVRKGAATAFSRIQSLATAVKTSMEKQSCYKRMGKGKGPGKQMLSLRMKKSFCRVVGC